MNADEENAVDLRVLNLGAGVQSSTMALMFARGEIKPLPDCAIFADTGAEPRRVYQWLDWLEGQLPFPVYRVQWQQGLLEHVIESTKGKRFAGPPFYTGSSKKEGRLRRACTDEFKIKPIRSKIRELLGLKKNQSPSGRKVIQYLGISTDEIMRAKPARVGWIEIRWPLLEKRFSRTDCLAWMMRQGYPQPPRSACTFCPYRSDREWRELKKNDPEGWEQAVMVDRMIREGVRGTKKELFVHRSTRPLEDIDFRDEFDRGQIDLFNNECAGMCGV